MHSLIIFGASGDLTSRKLIPALYKLFLKKRLPSINIVGFSRTSMDDNAWRGKLAETTRRFAADVFSEESWNAFALLIHYHAGDIAKSESFASLDSYLGVLEQAAGEADESNRLYYLATAPQFYEAAAEQLGAAGLAAESPGKSRRVVIEKPFGTDLVSARHLNEVIHRNFDESQIYRIDHYLGKETVNNMLVLRFANAIFEPIWNRNYISDIQITANEDILIGRRSLYYEKAGILRDMFQNHLLQILTFTAMEPPARFDAKAIRDEKVKVLQSIRAMAEKEAPLNSIRGQYRSYRDEEGVAKGSQTATYGAVRLFIDNWRWKDVPIFLRSGKGMSCMSTQVVINFRQPPHSMFKEFSNSVPEGNRLLLQLQPAEGIQIHFMTKIPDTDMKIRMSELNFNFKNSFSGVMPDSYERLLLDALHGDASLFARSDEVEAAWRIIDPIQKAWDSGIMQDPEFYETGSTGPVQADRWIESFGQKWFDLCPIV
ncbi:glucose-6-phosphate dehydrogenase [Leadbettera azotonutricia]|uniref:Glucose-6-phosphate 1-dehydrogenase n=1 Tax=Leadbettera azotonutricia (strain ATCC BAA-888 / DSM 13862 / ZAS-9) TaxID=545695 RepID=F5YE46_LEAAZ|nr:glucose-6-phosphate dehydrogenase [Leadbettera azotonutricia]AEF80435.1 glucose-6-phosphate dehydrogenase [Leadbettera azotonutricia ZAS-9]